MVCMSVCAEFPSTRSGLSQSEAVERDKSRTPPDVPQEIARRQTRPAALGDVKGRVEVYYS